MLAKKMHSYVMGPTAAEKPAVGRCVELFGLTMMQSLNARHGIIPAALFIKAHGSMWGSVTNKKRPSVVM